VEADKRDENISIFSEEVGPGMTISTTSDALVRICLDQILQTEYGGRDEGQSRSSMYVLLPIEERDVGVDLEDVSISGRVHCYRYAIRTCMILVLSRSSNTTGRFSTASISCSTLAKARPPNR
jgi:hypothetical protein